MRLFKMNWLRKLFSVEEITICSPLGLAARRQLLAIAMLLFAASFNSAHSAVFDNGRKWPQDNLTGYTFINICINPASNAGPFSAQRFGEVISHVRGALAKSWERYSLVRFVGWKYCNEPGAEAGNSVQLLIQHQIENRSDIGNGATSIQFSAWGMSFNSCLNGFLSPSFDCVEQYAIHEFGHLLGFHHEWIHPRKPASCTMAAALHPRDVSPQFGYAAYTSTNADYDYRSIMAYWDGCVEQHGVRFGSESVNTNDVATLQAVYPITSGMPNARELDFGGAYGSVNGGAVVNNPATGAQTCPAGYTSQQVYGTSGTDWPVSICYRRRAPGQNPKYDFGGMWGHVETVKTVNPLTGTAACRSDFIDLQILATSGVDWDLHICYREYSGERTVRFAGVIGTVNAKTVANQITRANDCPVPYQQQQVLGTNNVDWPLSYCHAVMPAREAGLDFGGAFGFINGGQPVNNPATGSQSCPVGFNKQQIFGAYNVDWPIYICHRPYSDNNSRLYDFGGMWGYVDGIPTANPLTGQPRCASGFLDLQVLGTNNQDYPLHICYRAASISSSPLWFGGFIGTVEQVSVPNPATQSGKCPAGYQQQGVLGTNWVDWNLSYCFATPPVL